MFTAGTKGVYVRIRYGNGDTTIQGQNLPELPTSMSVELRTPSFYPCWPTSTTMGQISSIIGDSSVQIRAQETKLLAVGPTDVESHRPRTQSPKSPLVKRVIDCVDSGEAEDVELRGDSTRLGVSMGREASRMRVSKRRALRGEWVGVVGRSKAVYLACTCYR